MAGCRHRRTESGEMSLILFEFLDNYEHWRTVLWCPGKDSNLHGLHRWYLKPVRLPIPPPGHWRLHKGGRARLSIAGSRQSGDFENGLDFDADAPGQRTHADSRARVPPRLAKHRDQKIRAAVDNFRVVFEIRGGIDHAEQLDDADDAGQIAQRRLRLSKDHQSRNPRVFIGLLGASIIADAPDPHRARAVHRSLAGDIKMRAGEDVRHIVGGRSHRLGQGEAKRGETVIRGHGSLRWRGQSHRP